MKSGIWKFTREFGNLQATVVWAFILRGLEVECSYCELERATDIEHILPRSYQGAREAEIYSDDNLTPACHRCNSIAGDRVFYSFEEKRAYIRLRRRVLGHKNRGANDITLERKVVKYLPKSPEWRKLVREMVWGTS